MSGDVAAAPDDEIAQDSLAPTTVLYIRHGETEWNFQRRFQGNIDIPLNDTGREQAKQVATALKSKSLAACWCSPMLRAHETAVEIAVASHIALRLDSRIAERDLGKMQGRSYHDVKKNLPKIWAAWKNFENLPPEANAEHDDDVVRRVLSALFDLHSQYPGKTVAMVGHGAVARTLLDEAGSLGNSSITTLEVGPGRTWRVIQGDNTMHLPKAPLRLGETQEEYHHRGGKETANTTVLLCRHGESVWNAQRRFQGTSDVPLSEAGLEQAKCMAQALKAMDLVAIWTSPLARARDTATTIAGVTGVPLRMDSRLSERHLGELQARDFENVKEKLPATWAAWKSYQPLPPETNAEPEEAVVARLESALFDLSVIFPGSVVALIVHGANGRCLLKRSIGHGSITTLTVGPGRCWHVEKAADGSHLPEELRQDVIKASKM